ncbi:hypothetical protein V6Z12_D02G214700 [Gossypium hirsutum]
MYKKKSFISSVRMCTTSRWSMVVSRISCWFKLYIGLLILIVMPSSGTGCGIGLSSSSPLYVVNCDWLVTPRLALCILYSRNKLLRRCSTNDPGGVCDTTGIGV